jgi:hypothetical protein
MSGQQRVRATAAGEGWKGHIDHHGWSHLFPRNCEAREGAQGLMEQDGSRQPGKRRVPGPENIAAENTQGQCPTSTELSQNRRLQCQLTMASTE